MAIVVQKYGGSSVADVPSLRRVAQQVVERARQGDQVVVVVSAMGKTTDQLLALASEINSTPNRREVDMLVTAGERISMALLSMAIHELGGDGISFTGSQSGIITEDAHGGARILEVRPHRLRQALEQGRIVIVAGYQGVSVTTKEVTTLGRGGSDTTAVALAAALDASACEIYSDVDGVYSADPRLCPQARHLSELSYESMQTMAGAGAKVLNAQAVAFAQAAGITIAARKTGDATFRETRVHADARRVAPVLAVVGGGAALWAEGPRDVIERAWRDHNATPVLGVQHDDGFFAVARLTDVQDPASCATALREAGVLVSESALVTVVGSQLALRPEVVSLVRAMSRRSWVSATGVSLEVAREDENRVVQELHRRLIEEA